MSPKWWAGAVCDTPAPARQLAHAQAERPPLADLVERGVEDDAPQVAVVIRADSEGFRASRRSRAGRNLGIDKIT